MCEGTKPCTLLGRFGPLTVNPSPPLCWSPLKRDIPDKYPLFIRCTWSWWCNKKSDIWGVFPPSGLGFYLENHPWLASDATKVRDSTLCQLMVFFLLSSPKSSAFILKREFLAVKEWLFVQGSWIGTRLKSDLINFGVFPGWTWNEHRCHMGVLDSDIFHSLVFDHP